MRIREGLVAAAALLLGVGSLEAQTTRMPGTLRYGSGLLDVPVASVLPHLAVSGVYSGFSVEVPARPVVGSDGSVIGREERWSRWLSDGSLTVGLLDRAEVGVSAQSFGGPEDGGSMVGGFGRLLLLDPGARDGLGLSVGARYVSAPDFEGDEAEPEPRPGRLGFADRRLRADYGPGVGDVGTRLSPYVVASALLPGFDLRFVPEHDFTFVLGRGWGMFSDGGDLPWYTFTSSGGWFLGSALHLRLRDHLLLNLVGEFNGFDTNLGAELDVGGVQVGTFLLGANHDSDESAYRSRKWGLSASVAFCPVGGGLCGPELRQRAGPDTVRLPSPPPDTVVVERTGVTAYAGGRAWYQNDEPIVLGGRSYRRTGEPERPEALDLVVAGEHGGVPVFAPRGAEQPYPAVFVPVRPGLWRRYEAIEAPP